MTGTPAGEADTPKPARTLEDVLFENITLSVQTPQQELWGHVADPAWKHTDGAGHEHAYVEGGEDRYPTLERRTEERYSDLFDEFYDDEYLVCRECEERIRPGQVRKMFIVRGRPSYSINDRPVTHEDFKLVESLFSSWYERRRAAQASTRVDAEEVS